MMFPAPGYSNYASSGRFRMKTGLTRSKKEEQPMSEHDRMEPLSGEPVETDGVYTNEWGRESFFKRGDVFPADPQLGTTAWKLVRLETDAITGETEHEHLNQADRNRQSGHDSPRGHVDRGDK